MTGNHTHHVGDKHAKGPSSASGSPLNRTGTKLSLEQRRAQHAWEKALAGVHQYNKDYVNVAKAVPALIMNSGLMQVLAFLNGKDPKHRLVAEHLHDWLHQQHGLPAEFGACMEALMQDTGPREFQAITAEALAWLKWLRQMADAQAGQEA